MNRTVTLLSAAILFSGTALFAQTGSSDRMTGPGSPDQAFMMKAAQGGMAEVKLGHLATQNAQNEAVKTFGQRMIDDHSKANNELKGLASQKGVTLPSDIDAKDQATYDRLSGLHGAAFDKAYMRDMVMDHRKDIADFQHEADHGRDPDLKTWAGKTLPILQEHLRLAEDTETKIRPEK